MENPLSAIQFKLCKTCGNRFDRPSRIANAQWEGRKYCSTKCQPKPVAQFIPCRICGQPTKYHGNENSRLAGMVRCQSDACKEASRLQKNEAIGAKAKQMYADGERAVTPEVKAKISAKLAGQKHGNYSAEHCAAISAAKKGKTTEAMRAAFQLMKGVPTGRDPWNKGIVLGPQPAELVERRVAPLRGRPMPAHVRAAVAKANKGRSFSLAHRQALGLTRKRLWAEGRHKAFRSKLEKRLGEIIAPLGFVPQFRINGYSHPYDYGHAEKRIVIEVNGCFWHSHGCGVKQCKDNSKERDRLHEVTARELGFEIFTFWQCQESDWPNQLKECGILSE